MAFKDRIERLIAYFDTDDVTDAESNMDLSHQVEQKSVQTQKESRDTSQVIKEQESVRQPRQMSQQKPEYSQSHQQSKSSVTQRRKPTNVPSYHNAQQQHRETQDVSVPQLTILLKYPKLYDDAQDIVDLLSRDVCVLIDFQYMLDAQARRCLDFIDGASKVLEGTLKKVGSSIYLLAPKIVSVNFEEAVHAVSQEANFDFDMKRR
ncbi:cell division protein SepF [Streptococcus sciuri]|uniref:Cell division protein SepF n=1 Tax=Streptococcus sciuri TaxID=2973939 RepID=A0ABT2F7U1_9STRE|nr:cell division protein SepF [Streptococcus sciuri]MCS4488566.1 cell division protein SepF [Streptococcus sciuri]